MARLLWVATSNGVLFYWGLRFAPLSFGVLLCMVCLAGWILELSKRRLARAVNIGIPAILTCLMVSWVVGMPAIATFQHSQHLGEAYEGAFFILLLAGCPLCLAVITFLAYWLIDIEPSPSPTALGL